MNPHRGGLDQLKKIAFSAGETILAHYHSTYEVRHKEDASPVTDADLRSDELIRSELQSRFPDVAILSEESASKGQPAAGAYFLVDPLDGTKEFARHNDEFTVNIALVEQDLPVLGVVYAPALREMFYADRDLGSWKETKAETVKLRVAPFGGERALRIIRSRSHSGADFTDWLTRVPFKHEVAVAGSSLKFCRIAEGQADLYPRLGPTRHWDTAAGQCVLEAAGGSVLEASGKSLQYGWNRSVLNPPFLAVGDDTLRDLVKTLP